MALLSPYEIRRILSKYSDKNGMPSDDFRLLKSWAEYDEGQKHEDGERPLKALYYEIEVINPKTGEEKRLFKALRLGRVTRLPKGAKQSLALMDMHAQVLSSVYEQGYNLITVISNIIDPVPLGLLFLYGVQGVAGTPEEALAKANTDFTGLSALIQGTYRTLHFRDIVSQEAEWLREKMYSMDYMTVVRGIPKAREGGEDAGNKGMGGVNLNPDSQGTLEEIILGMVDHEYVIQILSTPVRMATLRNWSARTQADMTEWQGQMQGTRGVSASLSMPMMFMANTGSSEGWSQAHSDGLSTNTSSGESFSIGSGESVGHSISDSIGKSLGHSDGLSSGNSVSISSGASQGQSFGQTLGVTEGISESLSESESASRTLGYTEGTSENSGTSKGESLGSSTNQSQSKGTSHSDGYGASDGKGISFTNNHTISQGETAGTSESTGGNETKGTSHTAGASQGWGESTTDGWNTSQGISSSESTGINVSHSDGESESHSTGGSSTHTDSHSDTEGTGTSEGKTETEGHTDTEGITKGKSKQLSDSEGETQTFSANIGAFGTGISGGETKSESHTETNGSNNSKTISDSDSESKSTSEGTSTSKSTTTGYSDSLGTNYSNGTGKSETDTTGISYTATVGQSASAGVNHSDTTSQNWGLSESWGESESVGVNNSLGVSSSNSLSESFGVAEGTTESQSISSNTSDGWSEGLTTGVGTSKGTNTGESTSQGSSLSNSRSDGTSNGTSMGRSVSSGKSASTSFTDSTTFSETASQGKNTGRSQSDSVTNSYNRSVGDTATKSQNVSQGTSQSKGEGRSLSDSIGQTGAIMMGSSGSMGVGPSVGYNKSYQWLDQGVKDIVELLEYQNERIKRALRGSGAFYSYVYIACPTADALSAAMALAKSTWHSETSFINPVQVLDLSEQEQKHLLYHFSAFSSDVTREQVAGAEEYKYATVLLPSELTAYTHLPRVSEGGIFAETEDVPKFAVPSMLKGEIYMGSVLSAERYSVKNGYATPFDYRISEGELMHGIFTGASRSGKTVAAMRFVAELSRVRRKTTGKRLRIVCMDPKQDWRALARFVEPSRFRFYSMAMPHFHPLKYNPCKIPYGVRPQFWIDVLIEVYCRAYGLLERGKQLMAETFYSLYEEAGVFEAIDHDGWEKVVPDLSRRVTFRKAYERMSYYKAQLEDPSNPKGRAGNDTRDAYSRLLERLSAFGREYSVESRMFGSSDGLGIDDIIGKDDVTVIESKGLESTFKNFLFGCISAGFFRYAIAQEGGYLNKDQYETVLVIEEANEVLVGNDTAGSGGGQQFGLTGQSEFEQMLDQAAGYGLFVFAITQKIADMPKSVIANSGLLFAGKIVTEDDINVAVKMIARDPRYDNRDIVKWFPRSPIGWFVCRSARTANFMDAEPVLVKVAMLNVAQPTNEEINEILIRRDAENRLSGFAV
jgi:hypothetical protein